MEYVQRELSKHKPATIVVKIESKAIIFKLLQQEQFEEEIMSLTAKKEVPKNSKFLQFSSFLDEEELIRAKGRISKSQLDFNAKHPILLQWKYLELFLRNEHKSNQDKSTEHVRNVV